MKAEIVWRCFLKINGYCRFCYLAIEDIATHLRRRMKGQIGSDGWESLNIPFL